MPDLESQIRLALDLTGTKTISEAIAELERLGKAAGASAEEIEKSTRALRYYEEITRGATTAEDDAVRAALELAQAERAVAQVADEAARARDRQRAAEEAAAAVVAKNAEAMRQGNIEISGLTRGFFDLERAGTALATGHGLARLGPMLERVIGGLGGAGGIGFGIAGLAYAIELVLPKLEHFFGAMDEEKAKKTAEALERQAAAAKQFQDLKSTEAEKADQQFRKYVQSLPEGGKTVSRGIQNVAMREADSWLESNDKYLVEQYGYDPAKLQEVRAQADKEARANAKKQAAKVESGFLTDPAARAQAQRMAQEAPELFPAGFAETISRLEWGGKFETPEDIAKQKLKDEAAERAARKEIDAKQKKESDRIKKETVDRVKAEKDQKAAAIKDAREVSKYNQELLELQGEDPASIKRAEAERRHLNTIGANMKLKEEREAAQEKARAAREAARHDREDTPQARSRREQEAQHNQVLGAVQQATPGEDPKLQELTARHMEESYRAGYGLSNTFWQILNSSMARARDEMIRGIEHGVRASQGHEPTQYGRG